MSQQPCVPHGIDPSTPNVARMYDYVLGGKNNYAADRELAGHLIASIPDGVEALRANRRFLGRAIAYVAGQGIDQFIDLGAGLPNQGNVHEVAQRVHPHAHVVYVDIDPIVIAHARALLAAYENASAPMVFRDHDRILRLFNGLALVEPGLVKVNRWHPDDTEAAAKGGAWVYGGIAAK